MTDVLGPADAGAVNTLTTTTDVTNPTAGDTWFQDCVANNPATGTNLPSRFMNRALQQLRRIIRLSGVPQANTDDDMLGQAIQTGAMNWVGNFGGAANSYTATLSPAPLTLIAGLRVGGFVNATNTGASTINVNGLGLVAIVTEAGSALTGGELVSGAVVSLRYDGTAFHIESQWPLSFLNGRYQRILTTATTFYINNSTGSDTTGDGSSGNPWATILHAIMAAATYNLNGYTITLQLALTGISYAPPGSFAAPSNGTLIIQGNATAQSSYVIGGVAVGANPALIRPTSGNVSLIGLTIQNASSTPQVSLWAAQGSNVSIQNVTFTSTTSTPSVLFLVANNSEGNLGSGCIFASSAGAALQVETGGSMSQSANSSVSGTPAFSMAFIIASGGSFAVTTTGLSWSGSATGSEYAQSLSGTISVNGVISGGGHFFPHSTAGTTSATLVN